MSLIVQKFGGTSVADTHHIFNVAKKATELYKQGNDIIIVVSAQGNTTDKLEAMALEISPEKPKREMDVLLSVGEQISISLLAMAINKLGFPAVSLTGWQAGIITSPEHSDAKIIKINTHRINEELKHKNIVIVAGFQGIDENGNITTLGRGGSDTSAVAIASAMQADVCKIYTDVDGVYTADPRIVMSAKKWSVLSYDEMIELADAGAQVLNKKSIMTAKESGINVEVLSSMTNQENGTVVKKMQTRHNSAASGVALDNSIVKVLISDMQTPDGFYSTILPKLRENNIPVDTSHQLMGTLPPMSVEFLTSEPYLKETIAIIDENLKKDTSHKVFYDQNLAKISVINLSESLNINIASIIFEALSEAEIRIYMVACHECKVSVLVAKNQAHKAMNMIHSKIFEEDKII